MGSQNDYIFSLYKPFRNQIRQYNLLDSLYLIWAYSRNYTFNISFPFDIEKPPSFNQYSDLNLRRLNGVPEFELEFLLKEFIINCSQVREYKSFRQYERLSKIINYLRRDFKNKIDEKFTMPDNILLEFNRIAHNQLVWQNGFRKDIIMRYYKIYSDCEVNTIIKDKFNLDTYELFNIGALLLHLTSKKFKTNLPIVEKPSFIKDEKIDLFLKSFSILVDDARDELKKYQLMDENIFYSYNPLLAKPLIEIEGTLICPLHLFLFWQFTGGIYYSIINQKGFDNAFGNSFQGYIGSILKKSITNPSMMVIQEEKYGKIEKKTTDWIVVDNSTIMFIECKAKRMTLHSKTKLDIKIDKGLEADLRKMASCIKQVYKGYNDYRNNKYPQVNYDSDKYFIPVIVTLEDWYINFNDKISGLLKEFVIESFKEEGLDETLIDIYPYYIFSSEEFESDIQLINKLSILTYFEKYKNKEVFNERESFLFENLFEKEFEDTFVKPLRISKNNISAIQN